MQLVVNTTNLARLFTDLEGMYLNWMVSGIPLRIRCVGYNAEEGTHWWQVHLDKSQVKYLMEQPQLTLEERYGAR